MIADLDAALDHYVTTSPTDTDMIPYFSRLWESAKALAEYLADHPQLCLGQDVLEFGCGLGLPSMTAAKLGAHSVTATDYHPDNEPYLLRNAALNHISTITYHRLDWRHPDLTGSFPLAFGSDLIYDKDMVPALVDCVDRFTAATPLHLLTQATLSSTAILQARFTSKSNLTLILLIFTANKECPMMPTRKHLFLALALAATAFGLNLRAEVKLPAVFADYMVLQRDQPIPVWGWAEPAEKITVSLSTTPAAVTAVTTADQNGSWLVKLPPQPAGGPFTLAIAGSNRVECKDVLIGEVWLCSGQSNMAWWSKIAQPERRNAAQSHIPVQANVLPVTPATGVTPSLHRTSCRELRRTSRVRRPAQFSGRHPHRP